MSKSILGYWDVRGLTEPIRYLLHYKKVEFEDYRYPLSEKNSWYDVKSTLGLDFPNLPYYIDGDVRLTQSTAILRYLAEKYSLDGESKEQKLRISLIEQQMTDYRKYLIQLVYSDNFDTLIPDFIRKVPEELKLVSNFLGDRKFMAGDNLTYVDFLAFEMIDFFELLIPNILYEFKTLKAYQNRVRSLPNLKRYLESDSYKQWPLFAPSAKFGGQGPYPKQE